jgi:hypothetical protein
MNPYDKNIFFIPKIYFLHSEYLNIENLDTNPDSPKSPDPNPGFNDSGSGTLGRPTDGIAGWRRLEAHGLPVGGLDVLEVVRVRLLVVTVLLDLLLEQAHRVPSRIEELICPTTILVLDLSC